MIRPQKRELIDTSASPVPVIYETHAHTVLCNHAIGAADAYCERAVRSGLSGIIFTEHNPMPLDYLHQERLQQSALPKYVSLVHGLNETFGKALDVRLGIECDFLPEYAPYLEKQLLETDFDYVIGSVHCQFPEFRQYAEPSNPQRFEEVYFDLLAQSAETGLFDTIAHPHLAAAVLQNDKPPKRRVITRFLDRVAKTGTAIELNTVGIAFWDHRLYAGAADRGIPVVIGGDAHAPVHVASYFTLALEFLKEAGYKKVTILLGNGKIETPVDQALEFLKSSGEPEV